MNHALALVAEQRGIHAVQHEQPGEVFADDEELSWWIVNGANCIADAFKKPGIERDQVASRGVTLENPEHAWACMGPAHASSSRAVAHETNLPSSSREAPWVAGLRAARANVIPGLIVQGVMFGLLLAYSFYPPTTLMLDQLAAIKERWGFGYSAVSAVIAGALIPELLRIAVFQSGTPSRTNPANLLFTIPFWCVMGTVVDAFYRTQAMWFGAEAGFSVVMKKVLVDQFLYNPLFAAPVTAMLYDWKNHGYSRQACRGFFTVSYYRDAVVPTLFATWGVWIPVVSILYSLPSLLQIPLFGLALSLWVMLYTWMSERRAAASVHEKTTVPSLAL